MEVGGLSFLGVLLMPDPAAWGVRVSGVPKAAVEPNALVISGAAGLLRDGLRLELLSSS